MTTIERLQKELVEAQKKCSGLIDERDSNAKVVRLEKERDDLKRLASYKDEVATTFMLQVKRLQVELADAQKQAAEMAKQGRQLAINEIKDIITNGSDASIDEQAKHFNLGSLPMCICANESPTFPVFRDTPHKENCRAKKTYTAALNLALCGMKAAARLDTERRSIAKERDEAQARITQLEAKCAEMRDALLFIRDECDWEEHTYGGDKRIGQVCTKALADCGHGYRSPAKFADTIRLLNQALCALDQEALATDEWPRSAEKCSAWFRLRAELRDCLNKLVEDSKV